ncbi:MAG: hypothetical protein Q7R41_00045, partial [Phycisphaerales bacterium]|nr:hypothetical protein [Phycisphaerales bacterium]
MFEHRNSASVRENQFGVRIAKGAFVACLGLWAPAGYAALDVANDQCRDSIVLVSDGNIEFTTVDATTDGPEEPQACHFYLYDNIFRDIWYRYTATCNGEL